MQFLKKIKKKLIWNVNLYKTQKDRLDIIKDNKKIDCNKRIIILLRLDAIGDFIIWQDSAKEYRNLFPGYEVILVCNKCNVSIAMHQEWFDKVIGIDTSKYLENKEYKIKMRRLLSCLQCKELIQSVYSMNSLTLEIAAQISAEKKVSIDTDYVNLEPIYRNYINIVFDEIICTSKEHCMELIKNAEFLRSLGQKNFKAGIPTIKINEIEVNISFKYYCIVLGTSSALKNWELKNYARIADYLYHKYKIKSVLLGTESELVLESIFEKEIQNTPYESMIGKTNMDEYLAIIKKAVFVLSGDTSAVHIAAALGVQSFAIGGSWMLKRFLPYEIEQISANVKCPIFIFADVKCGDCIYNSRTENCINYSLKTGHYECVSLVTVDVVKNAIDEWMCREDINVYIN